jgi:hypothetical protein
MMLHKTFVPLHSVINFTEQSPYRETDGCSAIKDIPLLSCNPKIHYRVHKSPTQDLDLSQLNPVQTSTPNLFKSILILLGEDYRL